ncbi:hypothetical protein [Halosimplex halobium]|uniref:hypothetical protein n=1 Tax=Halosimplex halobium TaxID=3396618 RepID=UPI003F5688D7
MKLKLAAVFASVLLVATGAAVAMPGNAPDHAQDGTAQADDHAQDDADEGAENGSAADDASDSGADGNDSDARRGPPSDVPAAGAADAANGSQGPPVDLPAQVPDFVSDIHETVGSAGGGAVDGAQSLGERISDLTPNDGADAENGTDAPDEATATPAA